MKTTLSIVLFLLSSAAVSAQVKTRATVSQQKHLSVNTAHPLYIVFADNKEVSRSADTLALHTIIPQDIESVTVLKDSTAIKKYGNNAVYGVVEIVLKDGKYPSGYKKPDSELKKD